MVLGQNKIRFRDSLQFLPQTSLSAFPKLFGLKTGAKGHFPHALNTSRWLQWNRRKQLVFTEKEADGTVHRFPPLKYFLTDSLSAKKKAELEKWHKSEVAKYAKYPHLRYFVKDQILAYCRQDVRVLREGMMAFRTAFLAEYPLIEPFVSLTLPSLCNTTYRSF